MNIDDLLVEVRNSALERKGAILKDDLQLDAEIPFNSVGNWTITIAHNHPLADTLASPGSGVVVTDLTSGEVLFSGPAVQPEEARTVENIAGQIVVQGITDEHILADALAWPDPVNGDITTQSVQQDERSGTVEAVIHSYVAANIGLFAPANRRNARLIMGEPSGIGATIQSTARFDKLLTLAQNLALPEGLGFRVRQYGSQLRFETYLPRDQRRMVRLSFDNEGLSTSRLTAAAPAVTRAIVAGKAGIYTEVTDSDATEAESQWGRRIETFVDQQDTANTDTMARAGQEALKEGGFTSTNARFEPTETIRQKFLSEWALGDTLAVESGDKTYTAPVTAVIYKVDATNGFRIGAVLGDPSVFNEYASLNARLEKVTSRTSGLEAKPPFDPSPLDQKLAELNADLADLNTNILPALRADLTQLDTEVAGLSGLFPITGTNISDNAISTPKLAANAVQAEKIASLAIYARHIVAGEISTGHLAAEAVSADKIKANSIGANHLTVNALYGKRIEGATLVGGSLTIDNVMSLNSGGMLLNADTAIINGTKAWAIMVPQVSVNGSFTASGLTSSNGLTVTSGGLAVSGTTQINNGMSVFGQVSANDFVASNQTGSIAGDAEFGPGGLIRRKGSTRRIKTDFAPLEDTYSADLLLQLRPQTFLRLDSQVPGWVPDLGFVAEDAEELGLERYVVRNTDGTVQGFQYTNWVAALQVIVRHLAERLAVLEASPN